MEKWQKIDRDEQESVIVLDYGQKELSLYTARETVYKRLLKKIGKPTKIYYRNNLITGVDWTIPFNNENAVKIFSKKLLIRKYKINYSC